MKKSRCVKAWVSDKAQRWVSAADYPGMVMDGLKDVARQHVEVAVGDPPPPDWRGVYVRVTRYADKRVPTKARRPEVFWSDFLFLFKDDAEAKKKVESIEFD